MSRKPPSRLPVRRDAVFDEFVRLCSGRAATSPPLQEDRDHKRAGTKTETKTVAQVKPPHEAPATDDVAHEDVPDAASDENSGRRGSARTRHAIKASLLQAGLTPFIVDLNDSAALLSLSVANFQRLVRAGRIAKPRHLSPHRVGWLIDDLRQFAYSLPESDVLPPRNTGWRWKRSSSSPADMPAPAVQAPTPRPIGLTSTSKQQIVPRGPTRDRNGERPQPGTVYRIPGTDITWLRIYDFGAVKKEFLAAIASDRYTWAEMELHGHEALVALAEIKARTGR